MAQATEQSHRWSAEEVAALMRHAGHAGARMRQEEVVDEEQVHVDDGCHVRRVRLRNGQLFHVTTEEVVEDPDWWRGPTE